VELAIQNFARRDHATTHSRLTVVRQLMLRHWAWLSKPLDWRGFIASADAAGMGIAGVGARKSG